MRRRTYLSKAKYLAKKQAPILTHCLESGLVTVLWSNGLEPLKHWCKNVTNGCIKRIHSKEISGLVIEITSSTFCNTFVSLPEDPRQKIGTSLPVVNLMIEFLNQPFCLEIQVRDSKDMKRRFRMSTCLKRPKESPLLTHIPLSLTPGWNKINFDMVTLCQLAYKCQFAELLGLQIYANCRIRRVYFSDRVYEEYELSREYWLRAPAPFHIEPRLGRDVS